MEKHGDKMDEICGHIFENGPADSGKDKEFIGKLAEYAKILISNNFECSIFLSLRRSYRHQAFFL